MGVAVDPRKDAGVGECEGCGSLDVNRTWFEYEVEVPDQWRAGRVKTVVLRDRLCDRCQDARPEHGETPVLPPE